MNPAGETTRRAKPAFAARSRLAFAAFLGALLGLGIAPQAAHAAHAALTGPAGSRVTVEHRAGPPGELVRHAPTVKAVAGTQPSAPREQHGPGGPGGLLPPAERGGFPGVARLAPLPEARYVPGTDALALPDVRGPPGATVR